MFAKILFISLFIFSAKADIHPLSDEIKAKSYDYDIQKKDCHCLDSRLSEVKVKYYNFNRQTQEDGLIIVLDAAAKHVEQIFNELAEIKFPVFGIDPFKGVNINDYWLFKTKSIDDDYNYSGGFACKKVTDCNTFFSLSSFGLSIIINPLLNPYIGIDPYKKELTRVIPKNAILNINRLPNRPGKPDRIGIIDNKVVEIFKRHGFNIWGGNWNFPINYMQFSINRPTAKLLVEMSQQDAERFFDWHVEYINKHYNDNNNNDLMSELVNQTQKTPEDLILFYKKYPEKFINLVDLIVNS